MQASIKTDQPSSGKSVIISTIINRIGSLDNDWITLIEANNFSVPIRNEDSAIKDPKSDGCELIAGELFISAPLFVCNTGSIKAIVQLRVTNESGVVFYLTPNMAVPLDESIQIPIQGQVLLKSNNPNVVQPTVDNIPPGYTVDDLVDNYFSNGDKLEIRVSSGEVDKVYVYGNATESEASVHASYTEAK